MKAISYQVTITECYTMWPANFYAIKIHGLRAQTNKNIIITPIILSVIAVSLFLLIPSAGAYTNYISDKTLSPISEVNISWTGPT